ncbi:hypothetical protein H0X48_03295 [Candidatus Dependentiae bacterium]|nr:hypothetical protein [Candidatus Dependentiae bacterium]
MASRKYFLLYISFMFLSAPPLLFAGGDRSGNSNGSDSTSVGKTDYERKFKKVSKKDKKRRHERDALKMQLLMAQYAAGSQGAPAFSSAGSGQPVVTSSFGSFKKGLAKSWKGSAFNLVSKDDTFTEHIGNIVGQSIDKAAKHALSKVFENIFHELIRDFPQLISKPRALIGAYAYKIAFGSNGLTAETLGRKSKHIQFLCSPYTVLSAGSLDKKRRLDNMVQDQNDLSVESNWKVAQAKLIRALEHEVAYLRKALPCYDEVFSNYSRSGLRIRLARAMQATSVTDNGDIGFNIQETIKDLLELIQQFKSFRSFDDAQQKHQQTKLYLQWTLESFKVVGELIQESSPSGKRVAFPTISSSNSLSSGLNNDILKALEGQGNGLFGG